MILDALCFSFERYEAEALYRRALEIREECLGNDNLQVADTLFELGTASTGRYMVKCPSQDLSFNAITLLHFMHLILDFSHFWSLIQSNLI